VSDPSAKCCFIALFQLELFAAWIIAKLTTRCCAVQLSAYLTMHVCNTAECWLVESNLR